MSGYKLTATGRVADKIAFIVHEPAMYAHYASVWAEMRPDAFVIVLLGPIARLGDQADAHAKGFKQKVERMNYEVVYLDDVVRRKIQYRYVVTNHIMGGDSMRPAPCSRSEVRQRSARNRKRYLLNLARRAVGLPRKYTYEIDPHQYPSLQVGLKQIRFMYGADISDAWSLEGWNEIYDLFLCHGPNDAGELGKRFKGKTAIMGYPRYDAYFQPGLDVDGVRAEFGLTIGKRLVLWMPTLNTSPDGECSIRYFAEAVAALRPEFDVVVRPHPMSFRQDPEGIALLESLGLNIDRDALRDMNAMFKIADTVLGDHGGSVFGALYLGKKLVILNPPHGNAVRERTSSNAELAAHFPVIESGDGGRLASVIRDETYWTECLCKARTLSDRYFADYRGDSSRRVAQILGELERYIPESVQ